MWRKCLPAGFMVRIFWVSLGVIGLLTRHPQSWMMIARHFRLMTLIFSWQTSSWQTLTALSQLRPHEKAISWLLRFKAYLRYRVISRGAITVSELSAAERLVLMHVQSREYPEELAAFRACKPVARSSPVLKLDPMIHDGFLVVGGRLRHSRLMFQTKHPIILPANNLVSKMIVHDTHGETHFGVEWTLSKVRFKYWIVNARNMIKAVKRACVVCRKLYASPMHQKMSDLPPERCEPFKPPFTDTGFDVFGPFYVKHGRSEAKRYGIVFTCFTTRAIHIEKLNSLETDAFINALNRFVSRKRFDVIMQQISWADIMSCQKVSVN